MFKRHIEVGDSLGLHTLGCIYNQECTLASCNRTAYLIGEVHVSRSVNKIEGISLILHLNGVGFDSNTTFFLQIHVIQHLILHQALVHSSSIFNQAIRQSGLTMINMRYNTKISYIFHTS